MARHHGKTVLIAFSMSLVTFIICEQLINMFNIYRIFIIYLYWTQMISYIITLFIVKTIYEWPTYQIFARAFFLGYTFCFGILLCTRTCISWKMFGVYVAVLSVFHLTEFLAISFTNPSATSSDTFVINHSTAYTIAATISWLEFFVERYYFPELKQYSWIPLIGLLLCAAGEILRKAAIFTAKRNFNHVVQNQKAEDHVLVTSGVYNFCRHPSYVGWFYWSVGTQLILQNPFCLLMYAIISWKFFYDRILTEEQSLIMFFGRAYVEYQKKVGTGLPFISGYQF